MYEFEHSCFGELTLACSVEEYESIAQKDEKGRVFIIKPKCHYCGASDAKFYRIYSSFSIRGGTNHTKYMRRAEEQVLIQGEKATAFKKGGLKGLRDHRYRRREKTHDKTGRRVKPWFRRMIGD